MGVFRLREVDQAQLSRAINSERRNGAAREWIRFRQERANIGEEHHLFRHYSSQPANQTFNLFLCRSELESREHALAALWSEGDERQLPGWLLACSEKKVMV